MAYIPCASCPATASDFEGAIVQMSVGFVGMYPYASPNYTPIMTMNDSEAIVGSTWRRQYTGSIYYRDCIAGKQGKGMVEGWVNDNSLRVVRGVDTYVKTRVALTARTSTGAASGQADVPAGRVVTIPTEELRAYNSGAMIKINGYYSADGYTWIPQTCYLNTNWASGATGSYYIYFQVV